ncbi:MAG: phosphatidylserine decarboxylase [Rhodoferax sp.]|nr:phosphatidylserine decarboxylase [Rhodoferax sp.]
MTGPTIRQQIKNLLNQEDLNFLLTNRLPRRWLTQCVGRFSKIEQPLVRNLSIRAWKYFSDLDLSEAKKTHFQSMHDCFTRELKEGARPIHREASVLSSPVDAIIGEAGNIDGTRAYQAKGFPYSLQDLLGPDESVEPWVDGMYVTLRLTSSMYHRFHAPYDCRVDSVRYFSGDTWNVNPIALKRVEKLFCKNERAFLRTTLAGAGSIHGQTIAIVPVAAILVASIRLHFLDVLFHLKYSGPQTIPCSTSFAQGQEMGWFQHGSTIIVLAPKGFALMPGRNTGDRIRMGEPLMRWTGR